MPGRALLPLLWVGATAVATAMAWNAVRTVASTVGDERTGPAQALGRTPTTAPGTTAPGAVEPAPTAPQPDAAGSATATAPGATEAPIATTVAPAPGGSPTTTAAVGTSPPTTRARSSTTTTTPPPSTTSTPTSAPTTSSTAGAGGRAVYANAGGTVTVHCTGAATIALDSARPAAGWQVSVSDSGPEKVEVHFSRTDGEDEQELDARCRSGSPSAGWSS